LVKNIFPEVRALVLEQTSFQLLPTLKPKAALFEPRVVTLKLAFFQEATRWSTLPYFSWIKFPLASHAQAQLLY
jgi:hypothetical protein